jgi:hypothetical protein
VIPSFDQMPQKSLRRSVSDYTGERIGNLTAIHVRVPRLCGDDHSLYWVWMCECGNTVETTRSQLIARERWFQQTGRHVACHDCIGREMAALGIVDRRPRHCRVPRSEQ